MLNEIDMKDLKKAKFLLENPGLAAKIADLIGEPVENGFELLPKGWKDNINDITKIALSQAVKAAILTMKNSPGESSSNYWHQAAVIISGGSGGLFGLFALPIELPISTTIMLRSIADIGRSEGENIDEIDYKLACIVVLALGGSKKSDDASETGYFAVRTILARSVSDAAEFIAEKGLAEEGAPAIVRLITSVASRFSVQVSEKAAGQAVPIIGAVMGALINALFMDHFQDMAIGHFTIRRLERKYGRNVVESAYKEVTLG